MTIRSAPTLLLVTEVIVQAEIRKFVPNVLTDTVTDPDQCLLFKLSVDMWVVIPTISTISRSSRRVLCAINKHPELGLLKGMNSEAVKTEEVSVTINVIGVFLL